MPQVPRPERASAHGVEAEDYREGNQGGDSPTNEREEQPSAGKWRQNGRSRRPKRVGRIDPGRGEDGEGERRRGRALPASS